MVLNRFVVVYFTVTLAICLTIFNPSDFDHHTKLPHLCAHLYWTYNPADSTLSVSFNTAPLTSSGWVAWGVKPTGSSGMVGGKAIVLSLHPNCSYITGVYNLSSYQAVAEPDHRLWPDVLELNAVYFLGLVKFDATIALPEKMDTINQVWRIGRSTSAGNNNFFFVHEDSFSVLNLTEPKMSTFWKFVDGMSLTLSFEKGCTLGRKSIWNEYITLDNIQTAFYYSLMLLIIVLYIEVEDKKYGAYWKIFRDGVMFTSLFIILIGAIKVMELLVILEWNFFSAYWPVSIAALGLLVAVLLASFQTLMRATAKFLATCRGVRLQNCYLLSSGPGGSELGSV